eukprot:s5710_g4.t1
MTRCSGQRKLQPPLAAARSRGDSISDSETKIAAAFVQNLSRGRRYKLDRSTEILGKQEKYVSNKSALFALVQWTVNEQRFSFCLKCAPPAASHIQAR